MNIGISNQMVYHHGHHCQISEPCSSQHFLGSRYFDVPAKEVYNASTQTHGSHYFDKWHLADAEGISLGLSCCVRRVERDLIIGPVRV